MTIKLLDYLNQCNKFWQTEMRHLFFAEVVVVVVVVTVVVVADVWVHMNIVYHSCSFSIGRKRRNTGFRQILRMRFRQLIGHQ